MSTKQRKVAIIGAGISGVASAAHLLKRNVDVTIYERNSVAGGVWVYNEKPPPEPTYPALLPSKGDVYPEEVLAEDIPGPCHPGLTNNVPTSLMKMSLHEWPAGTPDYTTHHVMRAYIDDITRLFGVHDHIRYRTNVLTVEKAGERWSIRSRARGVESVQHETFDAVIVATGHYHAPRVPDIPGLKDVKQLRPNAISHSKGYRGADHLKGKNVLVIGSSASAIDVARDVLPHAEKVYHSGRGGQFDVPTAFFPAGIVHIGEVVNIESTQEQTKADIPAAFHVADGSSIRDIDAVILCTGYLISLPFLAEYHNDHVPVDQASEDVLITNGMMYHNLHKDTFYIPDPSLIFVGVPYFSANFSLFDFQAQVVAVVLAGLASLPTEAEMRAEYTEKLRRKGAGKQFHSLKGTEVEYVQELLAWVNPQLKQAGLEAIKGHTPEWHAAKDTLMAQFQQALSTQSAPQAFAPLPKTLISAA